MQLALMLATRDLPGYNYLKPLGLGYLKSYINMILPEINVRIYENIPSLIQSSPDCVGICASTEDFAVAKEHIKRVQEELGVPILLGGVHISLLPETLLQGIIGCIGEGEETLVELLKILVSSGTFDLKELSKVKGIVYWDENGHLIQTGVRELITPLDKLPFPDRDALGIKPGQSDTLYMFTSRGCPYNCKFCVSRVHWKKYREFSSDYVIHEMELLINKYKVKNIHFFDDLFIVNRKRLRKIVDEFVEKDFNINTSCAIRANLVDDELCELLKKLNIKEVSFGAESFSEPVLRELKRGVTVAQNQHALDTLHKHGIKANVSMIFDAPEETREDMVISWKALFNNLRSRKINKVGWGLLRPYPGCEYWDIALEKGIVGIDMDWDIFKNWNSFHFNDNLAKEEVDRIIEEWETKCYLVNLHFRDEPLPQYMNKNAIFIKKEELIKSICEREFKDETDLFVSQEYEKFLKRIKQYNLVLVDGWEPTSGESYRWINKLATFSIDSSIKKDANLLNLIFFIPNINCYQNNKLTVTLKVNNKQKSITVLSEGEHVLTVPIPFFSIGNFFSCKIICSDDFCPAEVTDSKDRRNLSIVISRFELAKDNPLNISDVIKIIEDG